MENVEADSFFLMRACSLGENGITQARMHQYARTLARKLDLEKI